MKKQGLRIFGLLAATLMMWAATPSSVKASSAIAADCECTGTQFKCVFSNGKCTCLSEGKICEDPPAME